MVETNENKLPVGIQSPDFVNAPPKLKLVF